MAICIERNCIRPAADGTHCVLHRLPAQRERRIESNRGRFIVQDVCDVCSYPLDSDQHLNHCR